MLRYCGGVVPAEWPLPKTLWLKEHASGASGRAPDRLVEQMTWLTWRLTGEWVAPLNSAAAKWHYRASVAGRTHARRRPRRRDRKTTAHGRSDGRTRRRSFRRRPRTRWACAPGIAVAMTGIDAHVGMAGIDVLAPGSLALITGTSTCQMAQSRDAVFDQGLWGPFESAVIGGEWTIEAGQASTGGTVRWLLDLVGGRWTADERYARADEAAAAAGPGADGLTLLDYLARQPHAGARSRRRAERFGDSPAVTAPAICCAPSTKAPPTATDASSTRSRTSGVPTAAHRRLRRRRAQPLWLQILADVAGIPIELTTDRRRRRTGQRDLRGGRRRRVRRSARGRCGIDGESRRPHRTGSGTARRVRRRLSILRRHLRCARAVVRAACAPDSVTASMTRALGDRSRRNANRARRIGRHSRVSANPAG